MRPIAILGTGPAGMFAAHAIGLTGQPIALFGTGEKSFIHGAQFLHRPIPQLSNDEPDFEITYRVQGDAYTYQRKVYGGQTPPFVSFSNVHDGQVQPAWSIQDAYEEMWARLGHSMNLATIDAEWMEEHEAMFAAVVSTIPATALCADRAKHRFGSVTITIGAEASQPRLNNEIVYDGTSDHSWYRTSMINGHEGTEWGKGNEPPWHEGTELSKPVRTDCTCWPNVIKVGRYGSWTKGELADSGFYKTLFELNERGIINIGPRTGTDPVQMKLI